MNIEEYKSHLTALLRSLPAEEREEAVSFYMESIADRIDEGMSEEEAVASLRRAKRKRRWSHSR